MLNSNLLRNFNNQEKTSYLHVIASLATADRSASTDEIEYLTALIEEAGLTPDEQASVLEAANDTEGKSLQSNLEILKSSELRFSLLADLIHFAGKDQNYSDNERRNVEKIAGFLEIDQEQISALDQFVDETKEQQISPEDVEQPGFLAGTGIAEKLKAAGIDLGSLTKGLLGTLAPLILAKVLGGGRRSSGGSPGFGSGGLGSLISSIIKGRTGGSGSGGILGNILSQLTNKP